MAQGERNRDNRHDQPLDILSDMAAKRIFVRLVDRTEVVGELLDYDQYMNLKIGLEGEDILIRGNNVILIATEWGDVEQGEGTGSSQ